MADKNYEKTFTAVHDCKIVSVCLNDHNVKAAATVNV